MTVEGNRFKKNYEPIADAISRADIGQVEREQLAEAIADALDEVARGRPASAKGTGWRRDLFVAISRDPIVECAGYHDRETGDVVPCPNGRWSRVPMHLSTAPDGRSAAWRAVKPIGWRCVGCGAKEFIPGYPQHDEAVA